MNALHSDLVGAGGKQKATAPPRYQTMTEGVRGGTALPMSAPNFRDHRAYIKGLFEVLAERGPARPADIYDLVADRSGIPQSVRSERSHRGTDNPVYRNRIQFARQSLVDAGIVISPEDPRWQRGIWELSPNGLALARKKVPSQRLEAQLLTQAAEGARRRAEDRAASIELAGLDADPAPIPVDPESAGTGVSGTTVDDSELPSPEALRTLVDSANQTVLTAMLAYVRTMSDRAFEYLVGSVLKAALKAESVSITQKSRDGGFDGVLTFDSLGIRIAVFEAKRYGDGNIVGRPLIDAFATAARRRRATHSLFVTSSRFSAEAIDAARDEAIRLVDGVAFVELMAKHGFGVRPREQFTLFEIDPSWSVDDDFAI